MINNYLCLRTYYFAMTFIPPVQSLFAPLDALLMDCLRQLSDEQWNLPTVSRLWNVKDVVAHLLDGNLRTLSIQRDKYFGDKGPQGNDYSELVKWLNCLNADWVLAAKRLSPEVLIMMHESTGPLVSAYYESLNPMEEAIFAVAWAGENTSTNAMHLAREYTEKWHHQQQIRFAICDDTLMIEQWSKPFWETIMLGMPHALRYVQPEIGTRVRCKIVGAGSWEFEFRDMGWSFIDSSDDRTENIVEIPAEIAWRLFTKSIRPEAVMDQITVQGAREITSQVLSLVAVMA